MVGVCVYQVMQPWVSDAFLIVLDALMSDDQNLDSPITPMLARCVCHCCPVPKVCLCQTFSLVEMFTIHVKGEKRQGCLQSEAQSKGRAALLLRLGSILEKSVSLFSLTSGLDLLNHYVI